MSDKVLHISDDQFDAEVLKSDVPAMVDFWAAWCGPCRAIGPVVEELAGDYAGQFKFTKMNVDENPKTPSQFGIRSIPTLIFFKDGQKADQIIGAVSKAHIEEVIKRLL